MKNTPATSEMVDKKMRTFSLLHFLEEILQCDAPIIQEVSRMRNVSTTTLLILQGYVMKSLEDKWWVLISEGHDSFWTCSLASESHDTQRISNARSSQPELPYKRKAKFILNPLLTAYAHACACTYAHTHTSVNLLAENNTVLIRKDMLTLVKDWNCKKNIYKCLTIPQFPFSWFLPKAEICLPWLLPFRYQVFAFFDIRGVLLTGLKITKSCSHLTLRKYKLLLKYKLLGSPQRQQFTYRKLR